jgi:hypothetical protein
MCDVFKSTIFYPLPKTHKDYKETCQTQCISSGLPVFARDIGDSASKAYIGCGYDHFCFNYYAKGTRHTYELLQLSKPTKIYIDFDHPDVGDKAKFIESTNKYVKAVLTALSSLANKDDVPFYLLEASTSKKLSRHVIFECFLKDVPTVEAFVLYVVGECPCEYLDKKVYTSNRLFRILYSYKGGKPADTALRLGNGNLDTEYNPFHVFKSLIQAMMPVHYEGPLGSIKDELPHVDTFITLKDKTSQTSQTSYSNGYTGQHCHDVPVGLGDFIEKFGDGTGVVLTCKENESFISCVVGGKCCPWIQRVHKNNNQYFTICKSTLRGFFRCADPECKQVQYGHVDVSCLWREQYIGDLENTYKIQTI